MKKRISTVLIVVVMALLLLTSYGCNGYTSRYKAIGLVKTNTTENASMSFLSFDGSMVFKLKCESENEKICYYAKLEKGSAKVFYDCNGTKKELFSVNAGDDISDIGGELQKGTVYIIVETTEACENGRFDFDIK